VLGWFSHLVSGWNRTPFCIMAVWHTVRLCGPGADPKFAIIFEIWWAVDGLVAHGPLRRPETAKEVALLAGDQVEICDGADLTKLWWMVRNPRTNQKGRLGSLRFRQALLSLVIAAW
jgi:hypothetical protein